ncbi:Mannan endo-1-6-alpha-mannosidase DCW1 [Penicillium macrosclerotiorum]|uniref:Mannan endo-1-6-alpha-mannosidase DCW1 n=1 Tax=Penicillium macrosclerotiorum TaxID=303699 RepID=UPI00254875E3|nr:Mannan endo-1-6-alpha-mannosidase DCW1 [Penicillium macrosclerotiorum]KAJ5691790.1 Mannan endo-1-6-alpha-mannosidase DCW1 [Penicillium macrosclerotiorum]
MWVTGQNSQSSWARLLVIALTGLKAVQAVDFDIADDNTIKKAAKDVATGMMEYYTGNRPGDNPGNLPDPYYWWEAGAMFNALIDYWFYTGDDTWNDITTQGMLWQAGDNAAFMPSNQSKTEGNDDQVFWGFAAMSAAERNFPNPPDGQPQWLEMAQAVFNTQASRWDPSSCGGGLRWQIFTWNNGYSYKNTISTGGFFNLAARLHKYTGNSTYQEWADKAWDWISDVGFMTSDYHFWDGASDLSACTEINKIEWTYNNGVFLLGAANMWNATEDPKWKNRTQNILDSTDIFFSKTPQNVMYERACETVNTCMVDQRSFKGYLARWMAATTQMAPFTFDQIMLKLNASATAAAKSCSGGDDGITCGLKWTDEKWDHTKDFGQQMAALEVIQSTLITRVAAPVTGDNGGTSKGNPGAGGKPEEPKPSALSHTITTADRAGAGILTALMMVTIGGSCSWLLWE